MKQTSDIMSPSIPLPSQPRQLTRALSYLTPQIARITTTLPLQKLNSTQGSTVYSPSASALSPTSPSFLEKPISQVTPRQSFSYSLGVMKLSNLLERKIVVMYCKAFGKIQQVCNIDKTDETERRFQILGVLVRQLLRQSIRNGFKRLKQNLWCVKMRDLEVERGVSKLCEILTRRLLSGLKKVKEVARKKTQGKPKRRTAILTSKSSSKSVLSLESKNRNSSVIIQEQIPNTRQPLYNFRPLIPFQCPQSSTQLYSVRHENPSPPPAKSPESVKSSSLLPLSKNYNNEHSPDKPSEQPISFRQKYLYVPEYDPEMKPTKAYIASSFLQSKKKKKRIKSPEQRLNLRNEKRIY